jgi:hypothetical protein
MKVLRWKCELFEPVVSAGVSPCSGRSGSDQFTPLSLEDVYRLIDSHICRRRANLIQLVVQPDPKDHGLVPIIIHETDREATH